MFSSLMNPLFLVLFVSITFKTVSSTSTIRPPSTSGIRLQHASGISSVHKVSLDQLLPIIESSKTDLLVALVDPKSTVIDPTFEIISSKLYRVANIDSYEVEIDDFKALPNEDLRGSIRRHILFQGFPSFFYIPHKFKTNLTFYRGHFEEKALLKWVRRQSDVSFNIDENDDMGDGSSLDGLSSSLDDDDDCEEKCGL